MRVRLAKKVVQRWSRGLGNYTWNHFGSVIRAHKRLESHYTRRGNTEALRALPGLPTLSPGTGTRFERRRANGDL